MFGTDDVIGKTFEVEMDNRTVELSVIGNRQDSESAMLNMMKYY